MDIKQKASRARALLSDPILREVIDGLRADQVAIFTGRAPDEVLTEARHMVWALDALEARLQSFSDDEVIFDKRQMKVAPQ
jgi:hypothetical protein